MLHEVGCESVCRERVKGEGPLDRVLAKQLQVVNSLVVLPEGNIFWNYGGLEGQKILNQFQESAFSGADVSLYNKVSPSECLGLIFNHNKEEILYTHFVKETFIKYIYKFNYKIKKKIV